MKNDWIIDVLSDLKAVAEMNELDATAQSLEEASLVALAELSSLELRDELAEAIESRDRQRAQVQTGGNVTPLFAKRTYA